MAAPIIGVCTAYERARWSFWDMPAAIVASTYLEHLAHSGAVPLGLIPSERTISNAHELVNRIDGLLLLGGADIDPDYYGQTHQAELEATVPIRDRAEIALVQAAMRNKVPILGICRGLHLMNVATGGTLVQDIGALGPERHRRTPGQLDVTTFHPLKTEPDSWIAQVYGQETQVNSHHHQAVDVLGSGARITATSPDDGVIEAVEWNAPALTVGVQWHPEASELGGVIAQFLEACTNRSAFDKTNESASADSRTN